MYDIVHILEVIVLTWLTSTGSVSCYCSSGTEGTLLSNQRHLQVLQTLSL